MCAAWRCPHALSSGSRLHPSPPAVQQNSIRSVDLARALALLALPRDLGAHPDSNERVLVACGQFGPFLKCGKVSRSVPAVSHVAWLGAAGGGPLAVCVSGAAVCSAVGGGLLCGREPWWVPMVGLVAGLG